MTVDSNDIKTCRIGELTATFRRVNLSTANKLLPFVMNSMTKISLGEFSFFLDLKPHDIDFLQQTLCEYVTITGSNGKPRALELEDIEDNYHDFVPLLGKFLEFNFGFFSRAREVMTLLAIGVRSVAQEIEPENPKKSKETEPVKRKSLWIFRK